MNLLPYNSNHIIYLRMPSIEGTMYYREIRDVVTASFGKTSYGGGIALLQIDGNHNYKSVKADIASWSWIVIEGGWIVLDDYLWLYGNGPRKAADEFLIDNHQNID